MSLEEFLNIIRRGFDKIRLLGLFNEVKTYINDIVENWIPNVFQLYALASDLNTKCGKEIYTKCREGNMEYCTTEEVVSKFVGYVLPDIEKIRICFSLLPICSEVAMAVQVVKFEDTYGIILYSTLTAFIIWKIGWKKKLVETIVHELCHTACVFEPPIKTNRTCDEEMCRDTQSILVSPICPEIHNIFPDVEFFDKDYILRLLEEINKLKQNGIPYIDTYTLLFEYLLNSSSKMYTYLKYLEDLELLVCCRYFFEKIVLEQYYKPLFKSIKERLRTIIKH